MGDDYRRKIESEMDRFEAEISSLAAPPPAPPAATPAFIPAQLRRPPIPAHMMPGGSATISAPPVISRPPQVSISGAPQVYRAPGIRPPPRTPIPQSVRGVRPMLSVPQGLPSATVSSGPRIIMTARPTFTAQPVITGLSVQSNFVPSGLTIPIGGMPLGPPMVTPSISAAAVGGIPLPPELSDPKPSTSTGDASSSDANDKNKNKKKKDKKPKKVVRCAGGSAWEDQSLQDWDPSDFRLFCGDLGNDVTDEVLTRVFGRYPSFQKARVIRDKRTNKTKGYGFVSFKDPNDFVRAVKELDGRYVGSRPIKLRKSNWKNRNLDVVRKRETERMQLLGINKKPKLF